MTMTSKVHPYKTGMGPFAPEVYRAPFPNAYRGPSTAEALSELERMFASHVAPSQIAAIVFEPQLGEGGFVPAPAEFVEGIRRICDREGIVMIADEVQTGFGRTGRMFAMEHYAVEADLITVAKSIAAGLPLSGVIGKARSWTRRTPARSGAPTSAIRSRSQLRLPSSTSSRRRISSRAPTRSATDPRANARLAGALAADRRRAWARCDARDRARSRSRSSKEPAPELAAAVIEAALERGLILLKAGIAGNCIRVLCPLTIEDAVLDEALATWEEALAAVLA